MKLKGSIECRRTAAACVTFVGQTEGGERTYVTLAVPAPEDLPPRIDGGAVDLLEGGQCRVSMPGRSWQLDSRQPLVHRDVSGPFYAALPPRRVPVAKRMLYGLMLAVAGSPAGRRWLTH
jgi:hypothetical protein